MKRKTVITTIASLTMALTLTSAIVYKNADVSQTQTENVQTVPKEVVENKASVDLQKEKEHPTMDTNEEKVVLTTPQVKEAQTDEPKTQVTQTQEVASKQQVKQPQTVAPKQQVKQTQTAAPKQQVKQTQQAAPKQQVKQPQTVAPKQQVKQTQQAAPKQQVKQPQKVAPKAPPKAEIKPEEKPASNKEYEEYLKSIGVDMTTPPMEVTDIRDTSKPNVDIDSEDLVR